MRQWLKILFFSFLGFSALYSMGNVKESRAFDEQAMIQYKNDPTFDYSQDYKAQGSFLSVIIAYLLSKLFEFIGIAGDQSFTLVLFRILLIGGIIVAVFLILRLKFGAAFYKGVKKHDEFPVNISNHEYQDYRRLIEESIQKQQFKLAIRYMFLQSLIILNHRGLISIEQWKAPYDYLKELPEGYRNEFQKLAGIFEGSWYGDRNTDLQIIRQGMECYQAITGEKGI